MNETLFPNGAPDVPWPTSGERARVPDTSMLPRADPPPTAAVDALRRVVQGAHEAVDSFSDSATPQARQLGESLSRAGAALRGSVRAHPLTAIAAALALGALMARLARRAPAPRK